MRLEDANRGPYSDALFHYISQERRNSPRIETPFPAAVRSVDVDEQAFKAYAVLDNFSSGGLYLRLARQVRPGIRLFGIIQLSAAYIAVRGLVLRTESRPGGIFGTAIRLMHHRFISCEFRPEWPPTPWIHSVGQTLGSRRTLREASD